MNRIRVPLIMLLCSACLVGCGKRNDVPRVPVKGRVTMNGKPLAGATVVFENKAAAIAQSATTDEDGRYEFITYNSAGLPAASYKVAVSSGRFMLPGEEIPKIDVSKEAKTTNTKPKPTIPDKYAKVETSGLRAEVNSGDAAFDFDLKP